VTYDLSHRGLKDPLAPVMAALEGWTRKSKSPSRPESPLCAEGIETRGRPSSLGDPFQSKKEGEDAV